MIAGDGWRGVRREGGGGRVTEEVKRVKGKGERVGVQEWMDGEERDGERSAAETEVKGNE